ncbi:uncharacterized protein LOC114860760 [Betta splendens]|uniref:Uncharacterized protein LOC114860760 n=1 Tax=Betta splendens TaxID=158456 RepID=A0A6P7N7P1_BETSP|nr:uncharacterized protein LOC114860760 [Betta splendens]XP_055366875.1 uncharacterized protein LOC114860760 [Betta splendens]
MDASWFLLVVSAALLVSMVLLVIMCLDCRRKGPLVSIRETDPSDEYINPPPITHPFGVQLTTDLRSIRSPSSLLSPLSSADAGSHWLHRSVTPTETESNPSYENPVQDGPVDSDVEDPGYIIVLPNEDVSPSNNQSRASTPSLDQHDYENVPEQKVPCPDSEEDRDYLNVVPLHFQNSAQSFKTLQKDEESLSQSNTDDEDDESDDDGGNYVNELPICHAHSSA